MKKPVQIIIVFSLILLLSYCSFLYYAASIPESEYERRAEIVQTHYNSFGAIYTTATEAVSTGEDTPIPCPDIIQDKPLSPLYVPYLRRFITRDAAIWAENHEDWNWLTTPILLTEITNPTSRKHYATTRACFGSVSNGHGS